MYRVAYAGYDFFSSVFEALLERPDVQVVQCLTGPRGGVHNHHIQSLAAANRIPVHHGPLTRGVLRRIRESEPDILLSAAYSHRLPVSELKIKYNLNLHGTLLPHGRGRNPFPYLLSMHPEASGLTVHEMTDDFDAGDILWQEPVPIQPDWGFNELAIALHTVAPSVVNRVLSGLEDLFARRRPQGEGSRWSEIPRDAQTLHWSETVEAIAERSKRFGSLGVFCVISGKEHRIVEPVAYVRVEHGLPVGRVVRCGRSFVYVTARNGIVKVGITGPSSRDTLTLGQRTGALLGCAAQLVRTSAALARSYTCTKLG
jgi:methionyl-tRNA formyltransferase